MSFRYIESTRNGRKVLFQRNLYRLNRRIESKTYWKCDVGCKSSIIIEDERILSFKGHHNHPGIEESELWVQEQRIKMKKEVAINPFNPVRVAFNGTLRAMNSHENPDDVASAMLNSDHVMRSLQNHKNRNIPREPTERKDIDITGEWKLMPDAREFLLLNDGAEDKIVVFCTKDNLKKLCQVETIYMDGTFKACPKIFCQLYTLHAFIFGQMFPLAFCLLPDKTRRTYVRLFKLLCAAAQGEHLELSPECMQLDFELAVHQAIMEVLPQTNIRGCFFHYTQCIWRKVQELGLVVPFRDDSNVRDVIKIFGAMPLVPINSVDEVWLGVMADIPRNCIQLADYVIETWMDDAAPRFPRSVWNHHATQGPRTTNHLEGWHSGLNRSMGRPHPSLFVFIEAIRKEQSQNEGHMRLLRTGGKPKTTKRKYIKMEDRLRRIKGQLDRREIFVMEYVRAVSKLINFH